MTETRLLRLIKKAINGDQEAFSSLMDAKSRDIYYIATNIMGNKHDGEDAAQEAVIRMHHNIANLREPKAFSTWMYRVIFTTCMNHKRSSKRTSDNPADVQDSVNVLEERTEFLPSDYLDDEEKKVQLLAAIEDLPDRQRACLLLYYYEEMSTAEVAASLGLGVQAAKNNLDRSRKKLRKAMEHTDTRANKHDQVLAAGVPAVLTQVLKEDAARTFTPSAAEKLAEAAEQPSQFEPPTARSLSRPMKVAIVVSTIAALAFAGGGYYALTTHKAQAPQPAVAAQDPAQAPPEDAGSVVDSAWVASSEPPAGLSGEAARTIVAYASKGTSERDWDGFVEENPSITYVGSAVTGPYAYDIHIVADTGDGALVIITRTGDRGEVHVAYAHGPATATLPRNRGIVDAFDLWR